MLTLLVREPVRADVVSHHDLVIDLALRSCCEEAIGIGRDSLTTRYAGITHLALSRTAFHPRPSKYTSENPVAGAEDQS
jgi:hypothetical protein